MQIDLALVFALTFVIHLVSTLAYAVRIAAVRTGRVAVALALFNVVALVSRLSNSLQAPLLAKHVEEGILAGATGLEAEMRVVLLAAPLATLAGAAFIPTFQRVFTPAVESFGSERSLLRILARMLSPRGLREFAGHTRLPSPRHLRGLTRLSGAPVRVLLANVVMTALLTAGVMASLYAGSLNPSLRVTANTLSPVVNGVATVLLFLFVDPFLAVLIDDTVAGRRTEGQFRRIVVAFVASRFVGTVLAQVLFVPSARLVELVARRL